jgi:hypothetical protein
MRNGLLVPCLRRRLYSAMRWAYSVSKALPWHCQNSLESCYYQKGFLLNWKIGENVNGFMSLANKDWLSESSAISTGTQVHPNKFKDYLRMSKETSDAQGFFGFPISYLLNAELITSASIQSKTSEEQARRKATLLRNGRFRCKHCDWKREFG